MTPEELQFSEFSRAGYQPEQLQGNQDYINRYHEWLLKNNLATNADGSAVRPEMRTLLDEQGNLQDKYKLNPWEAVNYDTSALDMYKKTALRDAGTNSAWADLMLKKQDLDQANMMDEAGAGAQRSMMDAVSRLAQTGGISGGSREMLLGKASQNGFLEQQKARRQGMLDRTNILTQDEANRVSQLKDLNQMNLAKSDFDFKNAQAGREIDRVNNQTLIGAVNTANLQDLDLYKERMAAWGAGKTADAQKAASSGGGKK